MHTYRYYLPLVYVPNANRRSHSFKFLFKRELFEIVCVTNVYVLTFHFHSIPRQNFLVILIAFNFTISHIILLLPMARRTLYENIPINTMYAWFVFPDFVSQLLL